MQTCKEKGPRRALLCVELDLKERASSELQQMRFSVSYWKTCENLELPRGIMEYNYCKVGQSIYQWYASHGYRDP